MTLVPSVYSVTSLRDPSGDILVVRDLTLLLPKEGSDFKLAPCDSNELVCDLAALVFIVGRECAPLLPKEVVDCVSSIVDPGLCPAADVDKSFLPRSRDERFTVVVVVPSALKVVSTLEPSAVKVVVFRAEVCRTLGLPCSSTLLIIVLLITLVLLGLVAPLRDAVEEDDSSNDGSGVATTTGMESTLYAAAKRSSLLASNDASVVARAPEVGGFKSFGAANSLVSPSSSNRAAAA